MVKLSPLFGYFESAFLLLVLILIPIFIYKLNKQPVKEKGLTKAFIILVVCICGVIIYMIEAIRFANFQLTEKPVIYLYPEKTTNINVKLNYNGVLKCTYPQYKNGWNVTAYPDGTLIDSSDNYKYQYIYWEGQTKFKDWDMSKGYVIPGGGTKDFLQDILPKLGLSNSEANEFIVYWLPYMQDNKYNLIHFADKEEYEKLATLTITPKPDSILRVFMVFKPINTYIKIPEQTIKPFTRKGFTVVEWGGTELK